MLSWRRVKSCNLLRKLFFLFKSQLISWKCSVGNQSGIVMIELLFIMKLNAD